jgi:hypothetical protein
MRHNLDMFSTDHVPLMLSSTQMLGHMVDPYPSTTLADYSRVSFTRHVPLMLSSTVGSASTTLADYSRVSFTRHVVNTSDVLNNIYIIYISDKSLSRFRSNVFLKKIMK